ncbi:MAG: 6-pyruvoyl trahydropterin synthase family protein [Breznakibacter sp.]|nr:6-carboxytetrahydropterin synthase [Chitinophagales bacterium]
MAKVRITKEFRFEMAHLLWKYDGLCKNIHGHSYILYVTVLGDIINNPDDPKLGMVIDFGDLKRIVKEEIVDVLDHAIAVNDNSPHVHLDQYTERIIRLPYQPTCENMVVDFADRIKMQLPQHLTLFSIKLHETATSFAEWFASDNE